MSEYLQDCWADLMDVLDRIAAALEKIAADPLTPKEQSE